VSGGAARSFHRSFAAGEDLVHSLVDPHVGFRAIWFFLV